MSQQFTSWILRRGVLIGLMLLTAITWLPRLRGPIDLRWDAGVYYITGTSLADGKGYRLLNEPGAIWAVQYPPGLPLLIAASEKLLGTSDYVKVGHWLRIAYLLLSLGYTAAVYRLARDYIAPGWAALATGMCVLAFQTLYMSDLLYTEIPFALAGTLFLICLRRAHKSGYAIATGFLAVAAYLLRSAGIAVLFVWIADSLINRRFKQALLRAVISAAPVLAWQGYIHSVTSSTEYSHPFYAYQRADYQYSNVPYAQNVRLRDPFVPERGVGTSWELFQRTLRHTLYLPSAIGQAISASDSFWKWPLGRINHLSGRNLLPARLVYFPLLVLGVGSILGLATLAWRGEWPLVLFLICSLALICLTPWPEQFTRYMTPMVPMWLVALFAGIAPTVRFAKSRKGLLSVVVPACIAVLLGSAILVDLFTDTKTLRGAVSRVTYADAQGDLSSGGLLFVTPSWQALYKAWEWTRQHAAAGDVMATTVPHTAFVCTGIKTVLLPMESDPAAERRMLDSVPVRFLVTDNLLYPKISERYAYPAICNRPDVWRLVFESTSQNPADPVPGISCVYERVRK